MPQQMPLTVLEQVQVFLSGLGLIEGAIALEAEARLCFTVSQLQRCSRRWVLQARGMRLVAATQHRRALMWRTHAEDWTVRMERLLGTVDELDQELAVVPRTRQLIHLRNLDHELLGRLFLRRPSLVQWASRERAAIRAEMEANETSSDSEGGV